MKSSRQGSVTLRTSPTSSIRQPQGSTTNSSPQKLSPFKAEKTPCQSRGNSPGLKMPINKKKNLPLHRETKKAGPYIFEPDTVESITTENINPFPSKKFSEKDLDARLQLGELKLSCLDNRITQCLENSRKVLSITETFCRQTADGIASERILPANSELILSYSKSKNKSDDEIVDHDQVDMKQDILKQEEHPNPAKNINISEGKQTEGIQLARSKSCSIVPQDLAIDIIKDKLENFAQKGFLSTKNKRQDKIINLKQKDLSFKDLMNTISPSIRKLKLMMPFDYDKFEEKVNSLQTIGLLSPKEFDIQSMVSIKEEAGKDQDLNKFLKQSGHMTNSSNLEELRDFLSLLHNIDAKTGRHSEASNLSYFDTNRQNNDQKGNNNILQIEEIQLEEEKETRPSLENKNPKSSQTQEKAQKKMKPSKSEKAIKLLAVKQEESINHLLVQPETYTPREIQPKSPYQSRFEGTEPKSTSRIRTSPRKLASNRKEVLKAQENNSRNHTARDKIKSPARPSSDSRSPQKTREQSREGDQSRGNSKNSREKSLTKPEKKNSKEEIQRDSLEDPATAMIMKRKKEAVQNLISKFMRDTERRKESLERARAAKDEKEKQTLSLMNQVFTNKNNNTESKVRQYICRSRGRIESNNGSETQRVEKTSFLQEKRTKKVSFSIEKSPNRVIKGETSNISHQKPIIKEPIGVSIVKDLKEIEKVCLKENKELDLDYLRGLRSDIEKIKENIEEKIQGIEKANISRGNSEKHITKSILKKTELGLAKGSKSTNHSLERLNERSQKGRVKTRFQNSSSRIIEYMGGGAKTEKASSRIETNKLFEPTPTNSLNQLTRTSSSTKNLRTKEQLTPRRWFNNDMKDKQISQTKSTFMVDVQAMNYVNQLISDFKDIQGLKSPRKK